jgi:lipoic acid synthetase
MVGLGETTEELLQTFRDLRAADCQILTVGQYLAPTPKHIPIERYYTPDEFQYLKSEALGMGFKFVESGPLVRSSYHAGRHTRDIEDSASILSEDHEEPNERPLEIGPLVQLERLRSPG